MTPPQIPAVQRGALVLVALVVLLVASTENRQDPHRVARNVGERTHDRQDLAAGL